MKQKLVIAGPKVHGVGYRPFLIALADEFDISKFSVHNSEEDGKQMSKGEEPRKSIYMHQTK
jgi:hypothetical protein